MTDEKKSKGGRRPGPRPDLQTYPGLLWEQRLSYLRMRAQAKYRNEPFTLPWEDYLRMWEGQWFNRGSMKGSLCLSRKDWTQGWTTDNVEIVTREVHWGKQLKERLANPKPRKPYKKRQPKNVD